MRRLLAWLALAMVSSGCLYYSLSLRREIKVQERQLQEVRSQVKALQAEMPPVDKARAFVHRTVTALETRQALNPQRRRQLVLLKALGNASLEALEWSSQGIYVEGSGAEPPPSVLKDPTRDGKRWAARWR